MTIGRQLGLGSCLLLSLSFAGVAGTVAVGRTGWFDLAQAQPPPSEEEKKRREREKQKGAPPPASKGSTPAAASKSSSATASKGPPPAATSTAEDAAPTSASTSEGATSAPTIRRRSPPPPPPPPGPPPAIKQIPPAPPKEGLRTPDSKDFPKRPPPGQASPTAPDKVVPPARPPTPAPAMIPPPPGPGGAGTPSPAARVLPPGPGPQRFDQVQKGRQERKEDGGRRTVIQEPGNRLIIRQDNRVIIRHDDAERFRRGGRDVRSERRPDGATETFYVRRDGVRVVTLVDGSGRIVRRYRRGPDGRERNIIDNRRFYGTAVAIGIGAVGLAVALNLARPVVTIPRERYIVDYDRASDEDLYETLMAPPVETLERAYSLEEVRENYLLRDRMRRIDLDAITFEFGAWQVSPDQYPKLERIARAILRVLERNPDEVVMVEGHTDKVGSDVDNLSLSDRRAESVAEILSETFGVPPENLVTQGYGEQYPKVDTLAAEPLNRRVAIRRIGPLMSERAN